MRRTITAAVWHDTEGDTVEGAIQTWDGGHAASAHLVVDRDGEITLAVRLADVAWHAGTDQFTGRTRFWGSHNVNPCSVGIEMIGHYLSGYTDEQYASANRIAHGLERDYGIQRLHKVDALSGHLLHSEISNQRSDPGPTWDWARVLA